MTIQRSEAMEILTQTINKANGDKPDLVAVMGGEPEAMFRRAISELGGMKQFVKPGQKVVVKPNIGCVVLTGLIQGVGCELGFAVFRYRKYNLLSMALSGVFAAVCIFCYELYYLSYYLLAPTMLAAQLAVRFASAVVFSGVIAKLACDGLARTGVLRSYAVGARLAPVSIDDEEE